MKIKKFESFDENELRTELDENYISIEVLLELEPINHSFSITKEEWESLSEEEQREMVEDELIKVMGEENIDNIQNGTLKYFPVE